MAEACLRWRTRLPIKKGVRGVTHMPVKADGVGVKKIAKLLPIAIPNVAGIMVDESWRLLVSFGIGNESCTIAFPKDILSAQQQAVLMVEIEVWIILGATPKSLLAILSNTARACRINRETLHQRRLSRAWCPGIIIYFIAILHPKDFFVTVLQFDQLHQDQGTLSHKCILHTLNTHAAHVVCGLNFLHPEFEVVLELMCCAFGI